MSDKTKIISPSRTYIATCNKMNFNGHYFRKFVLPQEDPWLSEEALENNAETAAWYFLNRLNGEACIDGVFTAEDFANCRDEDTEEVIEGQPGGQVIDV